MRRAYALSKEEFCRAEAELELAVSLGLIGQAGLPDSDWNLLFLPGQYGILDIALR